ncbi:MAG: glucose-6-phosphate isomerase [Spirochaetes bacterium]|nr:glucose-6-phosphate isomerase [Spirochaetota bacterium]
MAIRIDYRWMVPPLAAAQVESYRGLAASVHGGLAARRKAGSLPFYDLPRQDVPAIERFAAERQGSFDDLVVLGIGGSSLGLLAVNAALRTPFPRLEPAPRLTVLDNIDPLRVSSLLGALDPRRTLLNVITKSGDTAETMSTFLVFRKWLTDSLGERPARERIVVTTDAAKGALRKIASDEDLAAFTVPDGVGGRFSVLTPVGLLPAALLGIDIRGLLAGAASMDRRLASPDLMENPALLGAVLHRIGYDEGRRISVMFAYADQLYLLADWYRQLWAESLGKRRRLDGTERPVGPTPVKALGVTDQHSQVQLYRDGPDDKIYTFLTVDRFAAAVPIPAVGEAAGLDAVAYLGGHSLEELLAAEERATEAALFLAGRPVARIAFPEVSPQSVGEYFHLMEATTVAAGALFGIDPLDQPGVEAGKQYAYGLMGRQGFAEMRRELESLAPGDERFLFTGSE